MKGIFGMLLCLPFILYAQQKDVMQFESNSGVIFVQNENWKDLLRKAKLENKYIFLDCFTSWCGPCKLMDRNVYSNSRVGNYINDRFISLKVQMDEKGMLKDFDVKSLKDELDSLYKINAFPTYLFFSPEGKIVHRDIGYKKVEEFIDLAKASIDTNFQYYTLIEKYNTGIKDYLKMPYMANTSKLFGEEKLGEMIADDYITNYLIRLKGESSFNKDDVSFIASFIRNSKQMYFLLFKNNIARIDSIMNKNGYAQKILNAVIFREEILPYLTKAKQNGKEPKWGKMSNRIEKKYGVEIANKNILTTKVKWYESNNKWNKYAKSAIMHINLYEVDTTEYINDVLRNNTSWRVFLHVNDKNIINTCITWMEGVVRRNVNSCIYIDTYANLLYKIGRKEEAIALEDSICKILPGNTDYRKNLEKMRMGISTWNVSPQ